MTWRAVAPANLALIKYMGKLEGLKKNQALNSSLSYTLNHLQSQVELKEDDKDSCVSFSKESDFYTPLSLSQKKRFLDFFCMAKKHVSMPGNYKIFSGNNFPESAGAASSSSSFAALILAIEARLNDLNIFPQKSHLISISRQGSGSSCRSFFTPWALWQESSVKAIDLPYKNLIHQLVLVDSSQKKVSSSEAHKRVKTSPLFIKRPERAEKRLTQLIHALKNQDWAGSFLIVCEEFEDMHALFETSQPAFSYQTQESKRVLAFIKDIWKSQNDGPLMTMDAGPNIHLLYRQDQKELSEKIQQELSLFKFLTSQT